MRKIVIAVLSVLLFISAGLGIYYYHFHKTKQPSVSMPVVYITLQCSAGSDFGILTNLYQPLNTFLGAISNNKFLDSLYNTTDFVIEIHSNTDNNKLYPVLWFLREGLAEQFSKEFPQNLTDNQTVFEIVDNANNKLFYYNTMKYMAISTTADVLEKIPVTYLPKQQDNTFTQDKNSFTINISGDIFPRLDNIKDILPPFTSFYIPIDTLTGIVNAYDNKLLIRFSTINNSEHINIWKNISPSNTNFTRYIPKGVVYFEAYSFSSFPDLFNRMQQLPPKKSDLEQYTAQYQISPADTMSNFIDSWIWTGAIDYLETGEYEPIAGICVSDTIKSNSLLNENTTKLAGEKLSIRNSKKTINIRQLTTDNYFRHIFPFTTVDSDTVYVLSYSNHIWLALSVKALRHAWGAYVSNYTVDIDNSLINSSYHYYRNIKKSRASISATDNSPQALFLRNIYRDGKQIEHLLFQSDFSISPSSGTFIIW